MKWWWSKKQKAPVEPTGPGLTYLVEVRVTCLDVPKSECIPEEARVTFQTPDKDRDVQRVLGALSKGWPTFKKSFQDAERAKREREL